MTTTLKIIVTFFTYVITTSCSSESPMTESGTTPTPTNPAFQIPSRSETINYLALGDSYTIGEAVGLRDERVGKSVPRQVVAEE